MPECLANRGRDCVCWLIHEHFRTEALARLADLGQDKIKEVLLPYGCLYIDEAKIPPSNGARGNGVAT